ncbi:MAG: bifunctional folylpolyglutamate synthase/dihydrofolate synthase [Desulfonatronovibrio sp. MSAO_Bac4]|nr:MAG: bifunctional folylpolyglutamate synthase/dihydrofolate synthase [Desulfonatronovibrio sp. MSAO_Bac4]
MDLGLERMHAGIELLGGQPHYPAVQIVGTNGKGSTACFLESLARCSRLKTGLFTSPHLVHFRERIRIDSELLSEEAWVVAANKVYGLCRELNLTYFELLTIIGLEIFREQQIDLAVLEAGLGGRFDATSAITPALNIFTRIGLDHISVLGSNLEEIARDKSMAMKKGPVIIARQDGQALNVLLNRAEQVGADVFLVDEFFEFVGTEAVLRDFPEIMIISRELGLKGRHQLDNAATAILAWKVLCSEYGYVFDLQNCLAGLKKAFWPGRMHIVRNEPVVILDGAHNCQAFEALKDSLEDMKIRPETIIFSCMKDKDLSNLVKAVKEMGALEILVPDIKDNPRAMSKCDLAAMIGNKAKPLDNIVEFLKNIDNDQGPVLVCGSLYLIGEVYAAFPEWMESRQTG